MSYNSLEIYKRNSRTFGVIKDGIDINEYATGAFIGNASGEYINIKTITGQPAFINVPYTVITYIDEAEGTSETFENPVQAYTRLAEVGFFVDRTPEGGGGGSTTLKGLSDVSMGTTFAGKAGWFGVINDTATAFTLKFFKIISRITEALDWQGGALLPNKYLTTNSTGTGIIQADIDLIINRPIGVDEFRVIAKGINPDTGNPNIEDFVKEPGDFCQGVYSADRILYDLVYNGGDETLFTSYTPITQKQNTNFVT